MNKQMLKKLLVWVMLSFWVI